MSKYFFKNSVRIEKILEHIFIAEILKEDHLLHNKLSSIEISRPEVDAYGYDLICEKEDVVIHMQLKTLIKGAETKSFKLHTNLSKKKHWCVVVIIYDINLDIFSFLFYGKTKKIDNPFPFDKIAKQTKSDKNGIKKNRDDIRILHSSMCIKVETISKLLNEFLF